MDLMMVKVDRNMLSYCTHLRNPVIRTQHLLCLTVINKLILSNTTVWKALKKKDVKKLIIAFRNLANSPKNHMHRWLKMITILALLMVHIRTLYFK